MRKNSSNPRLGLLLHVLILRCCTFGTLSVLAAPPKNYDPFPPNYEQGSISCDGPRPDWRLPIFPEWDPNVSTLQEICAKPGDGGKEKGPDGPRSVGLWCAGHDVHADLGDNLAVESDPRALIAPDKGGNLAFPRLILYCISRCFCRKRWDGGTTVQKPIHLSRANDISSTYPYLCHIIRIDRYVDFYNPRRYVSNENIVRMPVFYIRRAPMGQIAAGLQTYAAASFDNGEPVALYFRNRLSCVNGKPPFAFWVPPPFTVRRFSSNLAMCAVALSGGDPVVNAGGYCYEAPKSFISQMTRDTPEPDIWFSDEMTPRLDWTWGKNFVFATYVRHYCRSVCWCTTTKKFARRRFREDFWHLTSHAAAVYQPDGKIQIGSIESIANLQYLNMPSLGGTSSNFYSNVQAEKPWPSDVLGPSPTTPPWASTEEKGLPLCGNTCTKASDCGGDDCKCIKPPTSIFEYTNSAVRLGAAFCLIESVVSQSLRDYQVTRPRLQNLYGKRDLDSESWGCVCNQTYIAPACCESKTGLVWETSHVSIGKAGQGEEWHSENDSTPKRILRNFGLI